MSDLARKPRVHGTSLHSLWRAEERKLRKLDVTFRAIMDGIEADPTKAVMDTRKVLTRYLVAFLRNEGLAIPKRKNLFRLWVAAQPAFGDRQRFDPEDSILDRVNALLMVMETVLVSELEHLPNNGFHLGWCGTPKTFHTEEARLIALLGHVAATFVISIGSINARARFMRHPNPIRQTRPSNRPEPTEPIIARPSLAATLSRLLTGVFRWPVLGPRTPEPSANSRIPVNEPEAAIDSAQQHSEPEEIPF